MEAILGGDMKRAEEIAHDLHWSGETLLYIIRNPALFTIYNIQIEKTRFVTGGYCKPGPIRPPYNMMPPDVEEAALECGRRWAKLVATQLTDAVPDLSRVVFLAGERYREFLARHLEGRGVEVSVPMQGLRIGEQLSWLAQHSPDSADAKRRSQAERHSLTKEGTSP